MDGEMMPHAREKVLPIEEVPMPTQTDDMTGRRDRRTSFIERRIATVVALAATLLICFTSPPPVKANIFGDLGNLYGCVVTWGLVCNMSHTVIGTGPAQSTPPIPVTCAQPLLNGLPQFLTWPKGKAIYRFQGTCSSPAKPGAVMTVRWEGSWNPSETKTDRPNASETLEITGFEPFLPDRSPGGKIFMYWTARCTKDPWLLAQSAGTRGVVGGAGGMNQMSPRMIAESNKCTPFGGYVPDDLRQAIPDVDKQSFPRTGSILSAADKQRLSAEYARVNPSYFSRMGIQPLPPSTALQSMKQESSGLIMQKPSAQMNIFSRGTESAEPAPADSPHDKTGVEAESQSIALADVESELVAAVSTITFDQPLHFLSAMGDDALIAPGVYEIELIHDLQLSLAREGQEAILLPAAQSVHQETIAQALALLVPSDSNQAQSLVFLMPDGRRYDAVGSPSAVRSRDVNTNALVALPNIKIKEAMAAVSSGGPPPPCKQNTLPYGPRWIPVPCAMPAGMPGGLPSPPVPYVDGSNMLHACLNNRTGAFRLVRSLDNCGYDEAKVKWQLAP
jgi:hypothetical protein